MPRHVIAAAALCAGLFGLTACTDAQGTAQPTESQQTSTTTQPSTTPPPTPEEEAEAAALSAFEGYWQVSQSAEQAPAARNWEPELRQYSDDAATAARLSSIQFSLEGGIRQDGEFTIESAVTTIDLTAAPQPMVVITACFDSTTARTVDAETGEPAPEPPPDQRPTFPRWELRVTVLQYSDQEGAPWLVHGSEPLTEQPC